MKKTIYNGIILAVSVTFISTLLISCKEKVTYTGSDEESQNYRFSEFIKDIQSFPYETSPEKRKKLIEGFSKLTLGIDKKEAKKILGEPDADFFSYDTTKGKIYSGSSWGYYLHRHEAAYANDQHDQTIFIYFDPQEKLYWAHSDNIDSLKDKGGPHLRRR
jgi:hypothetical protein